MAAPKTYGHIDSQNVVVIDKKDSSKRVVETYLKKSRVFELNKKEIDDFLKPLETLWENFTEKRITPDNLVDWSNALVRWYESVGADFEWSVKNLTRQRGVEVHINKLTTTLSDLIPRKDFSFWWNVVDIEGKILDPSHSLYNVLWREPGAHPEYEEKLQMINQMYPNGGAPDVLLDMLKSYKPMTKKEVDEHNMEGWYTHMSDRLRKNPLERIEEIRLFLYDLADQLEQLGLTNRGVVRQEEVVQLEGFRVILVEYRDNDHRESFDKLVQALKIYKANASRRFPLMAKTTVPIKVYFDYVATKGEERGYLGRYSIEKQEFYVWPDAFKETPRQLATTIAHEMGHHVWYRLLRPEQREIWTALIKEDYSKVLNLNYLIDLMRKEKFKSVKSPKLMAKYPKLGIQLAVWSNDNMRTNTNDYNDGHGIYDLLQIKREKELDGDPLTIKIPRNPVSIYGGLNPEEAFCEATGHFISSGNRSIPRLILDWLSRLLPITKTASVHRAKVLELMDRLSPKQEKELDKLVKLINKGYVEQAFIQAHMLGLSKHLNDRLTRSNRLRRVAMNPTEKLIELYRKGIESDNGRLLNQAIVLNQALGLITTKSNPVFISQVLGFVSKQVFRIIDNGLCADDHCDTEDLRMSKWRNFSQKCSLKVNSELWDSTIERIEDQLDKVSSDCVSVDLRYGSWETHSEITWNITVDPKCMGF